MSWKKLLKPKEWKVFQGQTPEEKMSIIANEVTNSLLFGTFGSRKLTNNEIGFVFNKVKKDLKLQMQERKQRLHDELEETNEVLNKVLNG